MSKNLRGGTLVQQALPQTIDLIRPVMEWTEKQKHFLLTAEAASQLGFCQYCMDDYSEETLQLFQKSAKIYDQTGKHDLESGSSYFRMGVIHRLKGDLESAKQYHEKAILRLESTQTHPYLIAAYTDLGATYHMKGNIVKGLAYTHKGLELSERSNQLVSISECSLQLANCYFYLKNYEKAQQYIDKSLQIDPELHQGQLATRFQIKGNICKAQDKREEALQYYQQSLGLAQQSPVQKALTQLFLSQMQREDGQLEEAKNTLNLAIRFFENNQLPNYAALCYIELGKLHNQQKDYPVALNFLQKASLNCPTPKEQSILFRELAVACEGMQNPIQAYTHFKKYMELYEELQGTKMEEMQQMQYQYELSLKEKEMEVLEISHRELQKLDELKSRFFTHISHELRTPLTLILGPADTLLQDAKDFKKHHVRQLQTIRRNGKNMLQLIEEVLTLSKLNTHKIPIEETNLPLHAFIQRIFYTFQSAADFKKQSYQLFHWIDKKTVLSIDDGKLEKILNNLLSNAIKYTPEGGEILVSVEEYEAKELQIKVKDTGRGIHPDDLPHIFDHYFQSSQKALQMEGGVGVGLALVRELVELMGGTIQVESRWQEGSLFVLKLPWRAVDGGRETVDGGRETRDEKRMTEEEADSLMEENKYVELLTAKKQSSSNKNPSTPEVSEQAVDRPSSIEKKPSIVHRPSSVNKNPYTVLLVEDHFEMRQYVTSILSPQYHVQTAKNGLEAWELLQQENHGIHLILSDVMMPKMDGFTLVEKLKQTPSLLQLPVILLTARSHPKDKIKALTMGIDDYLLKPFVPQELLARIQNLLQKKAPNTSPKSTQKKAHLSTSKLSPFDLKWLQSVEKLVKQELKNDLFSISFLAEKLNLSPRQVQRRIHKISGLTPSQYIREIKLQTAREYLEEGLFQTTTEVSYAVGFNTVAHFSHIYQKRFGKRPTEFFSKY